MIDVLKLAFADTGSVIILLFLFRYVFGAELKINLKKMAGVACIYYVIACLERTFLQGTASFLLVLIAVFVSYMITCVGKRGKFFLYLIPVLLLYSSFSIYTEMFDSVLGTGRLFWTYTDLFVLGILIVWAVVSEKKEIQFRMSFWESFFIGLYCFMANFFVEVSVMIEQGVLPQKNSTAYQILWLIFVTVMNACVIGVFVYRKKHAYAKQIAEYYQKYFKQEYQAFTEKRKQQESMDQLRHDWKNHVNTVHAMWEKGETEQAVSYVAGLAEENRKDYAILSGNEVADAILNLKYEKALSQGTKFDLQGSLKGLLGMEAMDICVLLGNALDNALEACAKCEGEGYVRIAATQNKGLFLLTIENALQHKVTFQNNRPVTGKKDSYAHGYGVLGMEHVVRKYEGDIRFEAEDKVFRVKVLLPMMLENSGG